MNEQIAAGTSNDLIKIDGTQFVTLSQVIHHKQKDSKDMVDRERGLREYYNE
jgi:hypothetical protein